jgi:hypothetical protein
MGRFIVRYRGRGPLPEPQVQQIRRLSQAKVLDDTSPRMLLVEAPEAPLRRLVGAWPDWVIAEEQDYKLPSPHPGLDRAKDLKKPKPD